MMKVIGVICVLAMGVVGDWVQLESHGPHFSATYKQPYVLLILYNSNASSKAEKAVKQALTSLKDDEFIKKNEFVLEWVDSGKQEFFDDHYDLLGKHGLRFFLKNQLIKMDDFDERVNSLLEGKTTGEELKEEVLSLLKSKIAGIAVEINSLSELKQLLHDNPVVALYLGDDNKNYYRYFKFARKNIDFPFFFSFSQELKQEIYMTLSGENVTEDDVFALIRAESEISAFDPLQMITNSSFKSERKMDTFFDFNRYPKLRDESYAGEIVKKMFFRHQSLLLYVHGKEADPNNKRQFEEAVRVLPNNTIYASTGTDTQESSSYLQLFMMSQQMMHPESVYFLYVSPSKKVKIERLNTEIVGKAIVEFVMTHMERNEPLFDQMSRHLYDKDSEEEEVVSEDL